MLGWEEFSPLCCLWFSHTLLTQRLSDKCWICHVFSISLYFSLKWYETTDDMGGWRQGHQRCLWNCLSFAGLDCRASGWAASYTDDIWGDIRLRAFLGDLQPSVTATASGSVLCTGRSPKELGHYVCRSAPLATLSICEFNCSQVWGAPGACQRLDKL